jgi:hypothetical protein
MTKITYNNSSKTIANAIPRFISTYEHRSLEDPKDEDIMRQELGNLAKPLENFLVNSTNKCSLHPATSGLILADFIQKLAKRELQDIQPDQTSIRVK